MASLGHPRRGRNAHNQPQLSEDQLRATLDLIGDPVEKGKAKLLKAKIKAKLKAKKRKKK
jgi:hypothetical protein